MLNTSVYNNIDDFKSGKRSGLNDIDQLKELRRLVIGTPDADNSGANVLEKFNLYLNQITKAKILADNPTWVDADIEIVNISLI
jgi:5S rRNA maturation endonuclease (ribonuclease M5)